jgi:hypothetical protein
VITPEDIGAPRIGPLTAEGDRPFWSVMIPVYNRVTWLGDALRSVIAQFGPDENVQIEVVDDRSDSPAVVKQVVESAADRRIALRRNESRLGMVGNWNECLRRARGRWIHLLHDDDYVRPGFYATLRAAIEGNDDVGLAFTDAVTVDDSGKQTSTYAPFGQHRGLMPDWTQWAAISNQVLTPAVVMRRAAVEQVGGFHPSLTHAVDWEMWMRLAAHFAAWHEPQVLACYRQHESSETDRQSQSGENVADIARALDVARKYFPPDRADEMVARSRHTWSIGAVRGAEMLFARGQIVAGLAQFREATKLGVSTDMLKLISSGVFTRYEHFLQSLLPALQRFRDRPNDPAAAKEAREIRRKLVRQWMRVPPTEIQIHLSSELGRWHKLLRDAGMQNVPADAEDQALLAKMDIEHAPVVGSLFAAGW